MMNKTFGAMRLTMAVLGAFSMVLGQVSADDVAVPGPSNAAIARSIVDLGDASALRRVFAKAQSGRPITVLFVGGSITEGAKATTPPHRYVNLVGDWWKAKFPQSKVSVVNAGIGATGSSFGCFRADRDITSQHPDAVFVDFAVNDSASPSSELSYEGLVRKLLSYPQHPAVVELFMMHESGSNNQAPEVVIGKYYGLPMISYRDAAWPEIQADTIKYTDYQADQVHPNDAGHAYVAALVTHYLDGVLASTGTTSDAKALPAPLHGDAYQYTKLYSPADINPTKQDGWTKYLPADPMPHNDWAKLDTGYWISTVPGSVFECEVEGQSITLFNWMIKGPMGRMSVRVDDRPAIVCEGWFDQTWGGYKRATVLAEGLPKGKHTVHIEVLDTKAAGSTGNECRLLYIGTAGTN